jgi:excisionase family DNA binding protein
MRQMARRRHFWRFLAPALGLCVLAVATAPAQAKAPVAPASAWPEVLTLDEAARFMRLEVDELEDMALRDAVPARRVGDRWRFNREALLAWLNGDWTLIATSIPPSALGRITGTGTAPAESEAPAPRSDAAPEEPIGEAPEERTADEVFLRGQKVLLAPGEVTVDLGLFYAESDNQQLVPVNGGAGLARLEQDTFTTFLLGRVGLFEETELFVGTTYSSTDTSVDFGGEKLDGSSESGFGDVRLGVRRTVLHEGVGRPDVILTVDGRIPTEDGSYALGGGVALVKSFDPVVLFGSANYLHRFSRDFNDVSRLQPEDRLDVTLGYAYALNDTLTLSTSVSGLFTFESEFDDVTLRAQEQFSMQFGLTSWLGEGLYIEPSVSFGLNGPGDSFALGVTLPYTF